MAKRQRKSHLVGVERIDEESRRLTQWSNTTNNTTKVGEPMATMPLMMKTVVIIMPEVMVVVRAAASASKR